VDESDRIERNDMHRHPVIGEQVPAVVEELDSPAPAVDVLPQTGIAPRAVREAGGARLAGRLESERDGDGHGGIRTSPLRITAVALDSKPGDAVE
jgi:hypothetical protein